MKIQKSFINLLYIAVFAALGGCLPDSPLSSNNDGTGHGDGGNNGTNYSYPYLLSAPLVTYSQSAWDATKYDVTVSVNATGPSPIYSVNLWIISKDDSSVFDSLDLQYVGGTTWAATTYAYVPLPSGNYYLDTIVIEDGDSLGSGLVRSSWYMLNSMLSTTQYAVDQRYIDYSTYTWIDYNFGMSNIPIINFTLP